MLQLCRDQRGSAMLETAIVMPMLLLAILAAITFVMGGYSSVIANNAANYGARVGSVAQSGQAELARQSAETYLENIGIGEYDTTIVAPGGTVGSLVGVEVRWAIPNFFYGIGRFFGIDVSPQLSSEVVSYFRQEGFQGR